MHPFERELGLEGPGLDQGPLKGEEGSGHRRLKQYIEERFAGNAKGLLPWKYSEFGRSVLLGISYKM